MEKMSRIEGKEWKPIALENVMGLQREEGFHHGARRSLRRRPEGNCTKKEAKKLCPKSE